MIWIWIILLTDSWIANSIEWKNCGNSRQYVLIHKPSTTVSVRFNEVDLQVVKDEPASSQTIDGLIASRYQIPASKYRTIPASSNTLLKGPNLNQQHHTLERSVRRRIGDDESDLQQNKSISNIPKPESIQYFTPKTKSVPWWDNTMGFTPTLPYEDRAYGKNIENLSKGTKPVIRIKSFNVTIEGQPTNLQNAKFNDWTVKLEVKKYILIPITIPCLPLGPISVGSCTYKICDIIKTYIGPNCQTFNNPDASWNARVPCNCPILPGTYGLENILVGIPPDMLSYLKGSYEIKVQILDSTTTEIGCLQMSLSI